MQMPLVFLVVLHAQKNFQTYCQPICYVWVIKLSPPGLKSLSTGALEGSAVLCNMKSLFTVGYLWRLKNIFCITQLVISLNLNTAVRCKFIV